MNFECCFVDFNQGNVVDVSGNIEGIQVYWIFDDDYCVICVDGLVQFLDVFGNGNLLELVVYNELQGELVDFFEFCDDKLLFGYVVGIVIFYGNNDIGGYYLIIGGVGLSFENSVVGKLGFLL